MYKVLGSALALLLLTACSTDNRKGNPQTVRLTGGAVLYVFDSIAHGGADLSAVSLRDSLAHGGGDSRPIILTSASSTPSRGTTSSTTTSCLIAIHDTTRAGGVIRVEGGC
ncbi:MAG TPA: hypothetical protein VLJ83_02425 [Gemmatimonadaceae bacterium]|nr:hypothetical protein [Gemmatimonadaceae bacterium]